MLFWRLGATLWLFRWIFKDPKVDVRFLFAGVVIPDLIDLPLGTVFLADRYSTGELWAHALVTVSVFMIVVLLVTRRGRRRRAFMAIAVAWLLHLLLDGMWAEPEVFLWPALGWDLPMGQAPFWPLAWERAWSDPWRWILDAIGAGYMVWLAIAVGLNRPERRKALIRSGRLPGYVADET